VPSVGSNRMGERVVRQHHVAFAKLDLNGSRERKSRQSRQSLLRLFKPALFCGANK
jgi:hypothetical protein